MEFAAAWPIFLRVALGMVLGGAVGLERELARKPAGLRTYMLVGGAATLFVVLGDVTITHFQGLEADRLIQSDPLRIFEAIVVGISFLGAGTIFRQGGERVEGLTTAASLLFVAAIGIAVGLGLWLLAVMLTGLALSVSVGVRWLEVRLGSKA
jgi:putative Mg2+ transporter-C (MgtC) family protein